MILVIDRIGAMGMFKRTPHNQLGIPPYACGDGATIEISYDGAIPLGTTQYSHGKGNLINCMAQTLTVVKVGCDN